MTLGSAMIHTITNSLPYSALTPSEQVKLDPGILRGLLHLCRRVTIYCGKKYQRHINRKITYLSSYLSLFVGLTTQSRNIILSQTISIPLETKYGTVERFNILSNIGSDRSFILNSTLQKLDVKLINVEND